MSLNFTTLRNLRTPDWIRAEAAQDPSAPDKLYISGIVGGDLFGDGTTARDFIAHAETLTAPELHVHINSPGGSVADGLEIFNYLTRCGKKVSVFIDSIAASVAGVIAMAGETVTICDNAKFHLHRASMLVCGNADELQNAADYLKNTDLDLIAAYQRHSKKTVDELLAMMRGPEGSDGSLLSASEALEAGFVTEISETPALAAAACADARKIFALMQGEKPEEPADPAPADPAPADPPADTEKDQKIAELSDQVNQLQSRLQDLQLKALSPAEPPKTYARFSDAVAELGYVRARKEFPELFNSAFKAK